TYARDLLGDELVRARVCDPGLGYLTCDDKLRLFSLSPAALCELPVLIDRGVDNKNVVDCVIRIQPHRDALALLRVCYVPDKASVALRCAAADLNAFIRRVPQSICSRRRCGNSVQIRTRRIRRS